MTFTRAALAAVALLACAPAALAQTQPIKAPGSSVPLTAICFGAYGGPCTPVSEDNPLPGMGGGGGGGEVTILDPNTGDPFNFGAPAVIAGADGTTPAGTSNRFPTVATLSAGASGGCTPYGYQSAASTNATTIKAAAGTLCGGLAINTTSTVYYLRIYNLASAPTCSSATGFVATIPIPANTSGNGTLLFAGTFGLNFSAGMSFCLTGGGGSTDSTNAATGVYLTLGYN